MSGKGSRPLLAVLDRDEAFTWKLTEFMAARSGFPFEPAPFTRADRFAEFAKEHTVSVLLMDEDILYDPEGDKIAGMVSLCLLLEGREKEHTSKEESPYQVLERYRAANELIDEILEICAQAGTGDHVSGQDGERVGEGYARDTIGGYARDGRDHAMNGIGADRLRQDVRKPARYEDAKASGSCMVREPTGIPVRSARRQMAPGCELICVYSPVGRCGKTAFALTLGEILAEKKRVIYLNLERYSGLGNLDMIEEAAGDINDLIYYCRMDEGSLVYRLGSLVRTFRNLDYIAPAVSGEDVMRVDAGEWLDILAGLSQAGEYEVILLDLDISMEDAIPLLAESQTVYMPVLPDRVCKAKTAQFFEAAERLGAGGLKDRVRQLHLPAVKEELWGRDTSARLARGKMGAYVRRMLHSG